MGGQEDQNQKGPVPGMPAAQPGFTPLFVAPSPAELNQRLPQFEILELLGQGGMGAVYKARQPRLDRFVAIKLLPPLPDDDVHSFGERFEREARAMAQLNHPNIVTVHDFGETEDGLRYFVMEYVDGTDLHKAIASRRVTAAHVLAWAPQICAGLSYAHSQNLVHRDIKPANILISKEGQVKVGDFGLAKLIGTSRDMSLTQSQVAMGTPDYAAPEAMRAGADVDQRADLYSFGVVLYEMLTGIVPRGAWKAPSALGPVDPRLDRIVIKAMQPDREHRYQRMTEIAEALEEVKRLPEPSAPEPILKAVPVATPVVTRKRMHPAAVAVIALTSVAAAVTAILYGAAYYMKTTEGEPLFLLGPRPSSVVTAPAMPTVTEPAPVVPKVSDPGSRPVAPSPPPEKQRPPDVKDGWVSMRSVDGPGVEAPGPGWSMSLDGLVFHGKGKDRSGSRLFLAPPLPSVDYEFRMEVVEGGLTHPLAVRLPVGNDNAHAVFGASAPGGGRERFAGLALVGAPDPADPRNRSRHQLEEPKGESCRIVLRVLRKGGKTGIEATVNGQLAIAWAGDITELAGVDSFRSAGSKRLIGLAASHPISLHGIDCRAVSAGTWLVYEEEVAPLPLLGGAAPVSVTSRPATPSVLMPTPAPETAQSKLESRLAELRARYEGVENEVARAGFDRSMGNLRESYQAALNRTIAEAGGSLAITAAAQRELIRIREKEPLEETDPPEMPESVRKMREVYRSSVKGFESELKLATAPIVREHLAALQALSSDPAWSESNLQKLIVAETSRVESRLRDVLAVSAPSSISAQPAVSAPAPGAPGLVRPPFPPARSQIKGSLVVVPRGPEDPIHKLLMDVPAGLKGSVVDVAVGESLVLALKSNGRVSLWGDGATSEIRKEIESIDRVSRVALAQRGKFGQIALLLEDGRVRTKALGVVASGLPGLEEETAKFTNVVDVAVTPLGGVGLDRDGKLCPWGVFAAFPGMPEKVMQLRPAGVGIVALGAGGVPVYLTASPLPPGLPVGQPVADIQFGAQDEPGAIFRTPEGRWQMGGSFSEFTKDLDGLTKTAIVRRVDAGDQALAVQIQENVWRFLGSGFEAGAEKSFAGCVRVLISKSFVAGLLPE